MNRGGLLFISLSIYIRVVPFHWLSDLHMSIYLNVDDIHVTVYISDLEGAGQV